MSKCEHPREEFTNKGTESVNHCPQCRERICLFCRNTAPESWMSGRCHACYRRLAVTARKREAEWAEETRLRNLAEAWAEGWAHYRENFSPSDPDFGVNPYLERLKALP